MKQNSKRNRTQVLQWDTVQELRLESGLAALQIELAQRQDSPIKRPELQTKLPELKELQASLAAYGRILLQWHNAFHLLGEQNSEDFVSLHLLDSVAGAFFLEGQIELAKPQNFVQLIDVGSGLGLPGIPLALYFLQYKSAFAKQQLEVYLVEPATRRANILRSMIAELNLQEHLRICQHPLEQWPTIQRAADKRLLKAQNSANSALRILTCRAFRPLNAKNWKLLHAPHQGLETPETSNITYSVMLYKGHWQHATTELKQLHLEPQAQLFYTLPQCGHKRSLFYWQI